MGVCTIYVFCLFVLFCFVVVVVFCCCFVLFFCLKCLKSGFKTTCQYFFLLVCASLSTNNVCKNHHISLKQKGKKPFVALNNKTSRALHILFVCLFFFF